MTNGLVRYKAASERAPDIATSATCLGGAARAGQCLQPPGIAAAGERLQDREEWQMNWRGLVTYTIPKMDVLISGILRVASQHGAGNDRETGVAHQRSRAVVELTR
jgi:hypothetical protein